VHDPPDQAPHHLHLLGIAVLLLQATALADVAHDQHSPGLFTHLHPRFRQLDGKLAAIAPPAPSFPGPRSFVRTFGRSRRAEQLSEADALQRFCLLVTEAPRQRRIGITHHLPLNYQHAFRQPGNDRPPELRVLIVSKPLQRSMQMHTPVMGLNAGQSPILAFSLKVHGMK
jgi:hypothetical protein